MIYVCLLALVMARLSEEALINNCLKWVQELQNGKQYMRCQECRDGHYLRAGICNQCKNIPGVRIVECNIKKGYTSGSNIVFDVENKNETNKNITIKNQTNINSNNSTALPSKPVQSSSNKTYQAKSQQKPIQVPISNSTLTPQSIPSALPPVPPPALPPVPPSALPSVPSTSLNSSTPLPSPSPSPSVPSPSPKQPVNQNTPVYSLANDNQSVSLNSLSLLLQNCKQVDFKNKCIKCFVGYSMGNGMCAKNEKSRQNEYEKMCIVVDEVNGKCYMCQDGYQIGNGVCTKVEKQKQKQKQKQKSSQIRSEVANSKKDTDSLQAVTNQTRQSTSNNNKKITNSKKDTDSLSQPTIINIISNSTSNTTNSTANNTNSNSTADNTNTNSNTNTNTNTNSNISNTNNTIISTTNNNTISNSTNNNNNNNITNNNIAASSSNITKYTLHKTDSKISQNPSAQYKSQVSKGEVSIHYHKQNTTTPSPQQLKLKLQQKRKQPQYPYYQPQSYWNQHKAVPTVKLVLNMQDKNNQNQSYIIQANTDNCAQYINQGNTSTQICARCMNQFIWNDITKKCIQISRPLELVKVQENKGEGKNVSNSSKEGQNVSKSSKEGQKMANVSVNVSSNGNGTDNGQATTITITVNSAMPNNTIISITNKPTQNNEISNNTSKTADQSSKAKVESSGGAIILSKSQINVLTTDNSNKNNTADTNNTTKIVTNQLVIPAPMQLGTNLPNLPALNTTAQAKKKVLDTPIDNTSVRCQQFKNGTNETLCAKCQKEYQIFINKCYLPLELAAALKQSIALKNLEKNKSKLT